MADSISIKNRKLTKAEKKLEGKKYYQKKQEETDNKLKGIAAEVDSGSRSSKLKKLSAAKKKEMLEEYESIIKKLKELELRNKKKQDFKHSFKGLKYFPTLNGHSVYSESMHIQEENDKDSISAMMAYGQLGAGFDVTFEQMVQHIRPERRQEFLALCKNNSALSHNLMGMTKVLQFYNQRDFTRAYAAMVFFGLENNIDLMETFLKVKFNADFKMQVNEFKSRIAFASAYEVKAIREEAGTNVFSQHDSQMMAMQSSATGESLAATYSKNVANITSKKVIMASTKDEQKVLFEKQIKEKIKEEADKFRKAKEKCKTTEELRDTVKKEKKVEAKIFAEELIERVNAREKGFIERHFSSQNGNSNYFISYSGRFTRAEVGNYFNLKNARIKTPPPDTYFRKSNAVRIEELNNLIRQLEGDPTKISEYNAAVQERSDIIDAAKCDIIGRAEELAPHTLGKDEYRIEEQIINCSVALKRAESSGNTAEVDRLRTEIESLQEKKDSITMQRIEENGDVTFEAVVEEFKHDKKRMERFLAREKEKLTKAIESGDSKKIEELQSQIAKIEEILQNLKHGSMGVANAALQDQTERLCSILDGSKSFEITDFDLLVDVIDFDSFKRLTGISDISKRRFEEMKSQNLRGITFVINEQELHALIQAKMRKIYKSFICVAQDSDYLKVAEDMCETFDKMLESLENRLKDINQQISLTEDPTKKEKLISTKKEIEAQIETLKKVKTAVIDERERIYERKTKQKQTKEQESQINGIFEQISRNLTVYKGERVYLDELKPEEILSTMKASMIKVKVREVFNNIKRIADLGNVLTRDNIAEVRANLARASKLLDVIEGKISVADFEDLKTKRDAMYTLVESLENPKRERSVVQNTGKEAEEGSVSESDSPSKSETTESVEPLKNSTDAPESTSPEPTSKAAPSIVAVGKSSMAGGIKIQRNRNSFKFGRPKRGSEGFEHQATPETNGFEATLEEFKNDRKGLQRLLSNYKKRLEEALSAGDAAEKITELQIKIQTIEKRIGELERTHEILAHMKMSERGEYSEGNAQGQDSPVVELPTTIDTLDAGKSTQEAPVTGSDALFSETKYPPKEPAGQTGLGAEISKEQEEAKMINETIAKGMK